MKYYNYEITQQGKVFNRFGKELEGETTKEGYKRITLYLNKERKRFLLHRLIAELFIDNPNNYPVVNHINGNKLDNRIENLEWITYKENTKHALENNLKIPKSTKGCGQGKYTPVLQIDPETGQIITEYPSMKQAAEQTGGSFQLISAVVNGKRKTHNGFKWMKK